MYKGIMFLWLCLSLVISGSLADSTLDVLKSDGRFITLTNLLKQAKLDSVLDNGNFTIFAPTDKAFKKIPLDDLSAITTDAGQLDAILKYHVLVGNVMKLQVSNEHLVTTVNSKTARFNTYDHNKKTTIQGSEIIEFNKLASNGVIHVINTVMLPPDGDIVDYVTNNQNLSKLEELATNAGILEVLRQDGLTLFAPTNDAFGKLSADQLQAVQSDPTMLKNILTYHVVGSTQYSPGLWNRERLTTKLTGTQLVVHYRRHGQIIKINNGNIDVGDVGTTNGVVHVVDHVLLPPSNAGTVG